MKKKTKKIITALALFFIFGLAFLARVYPPYEKVFDPELPQGWIGYAADDAVYHMRIVENSLLGGHFPKRIYFDPYTRFPYGTYIHFAPLYTWLLAGPVWIASAGKPTLELINKIVPYIPVVLGCLMVFVAYLLGQALFDKKTGLLAAFLMAFSPPYLYRSLLGNADHHVVEVLFSALAMMFLIFALKVRYRPKASKETPDYEILRLRSGLGRSSAQNDNFVQNDKKNKLFWLYTILSGISLGLYFLSWVGALIFAFIIGVFIVLYYLIEYLTSRTPQQAEESCRLSPVLQEHTPVCRQAPPLQGQARRKCVGVPSSLGEAPAWILKMGSIIFLIPLLMIAPFLNHPDIFHSPLYNIKHLISLAFGIAAFAFIGWLGGFIRKRKWPAYLLPILLAIAAALAVLIIKLALPTLFNVFSEMLSSVNKGMVSKPAARQVVNEMAPLRLAGAIGIFSSFFFLSVISLSIAIFLFFKKRNPAYLFLIIWSLAIGLLCGIIPAFGQQRNSPYLSLNISLLAAFAILAAMRFGWQGIQMAKRAPRDSKMRLPLLFGSISIILISFLSLIYPFPINVSDPAPEYLPDILRKAVNTVKNGPVGPPLEQRDWYPALAWLKENTPETGLDYFELYKEPGVDSATRQIDPYAYPQEAYGVLSRWDVGHMITYYAHRIPVANPFQQGLGDISKEGVTPGSAVFFTETDEEKAIQFLEDLRVKYIITDIGMSRPDGGFDNFLRWLEADMEEYYASSTTFTKFDRSMVARLHLLDGASFSKGGETLRPLGHFRLIYESTKRAGYSKEAPEKEIKAVKIFEFVKGTKITGQAPAGSSVTLSTNINTNQDRTFVYQNSSQVGPDGRFGFTVPYAASYKIKIGQKEKEIKVSEEDVLEGKTIKINWPN